MKEARFCEKCGAYIPTGSKKCAACGEKTDFCEVTSVDKIDGVVLLNTIAAFDRMTRRMWAALVLAITMIVATNAAWIYYEAQFSEETWTYEFAGDYYER